MLEYHALMMRAEQRRRLFLNEPEEDRLAEELSRRREAVARPRRRNPTLMGVLARSLAALMSAFIHLIGVSR